MSELPQFQQVQYNFAAYIRNPQHSPVPADVEPRRMNLYSQLFYNNIDDILADTFPVLRSIMDDRSWHKMVRDYFATHYAATPLFYDMPREFLIYLEHERQPQAEDYPFMLELAHYEWIELALSISEQEADMTNIDPDGDLLLGIPAPSPLTWAFEYTYPVHQISPEFLPDAAPPQSTYLVVYRNQDDDVRFLEMNSITAQLLHMIKQEAGLSGREALGKIAEQLQHPDPEVVIQGGTQILNDLKARDILLGTYQH